MMVEAALIVVEIDAQSRTGDDREIHIPLLDLDGIVLDGLAGLGFAKETVTCCIEVRGRLPRGMWNCHLVTLRISASGSPALDIMQPECGAASLVLDGPTFDFCACELDRSFVRAAGLNDNFEPNAAVEACKNQQSAQPILDSKSGGFERWRAVRLVFCNWPYGNRAPTLAVGSIWGGAQATTSAASDS